MLQKIWKMEKMDERTKDAVRHGRIPIETSRQKPARGGGGQARCDSYG